MLPDNKPIRVERRRQESSDRIRWSPSARAAFLLGPVALVCGCAAAPASDPSVYRMDADVWRGSHVALVEHAASVALVEGVPPLAVELQQSGTVRVIDQSSGQQVVGFDVAAGQILSVQARDGVRLSGRTMSGALDAGHRYTVYFDVHNPEVGAPVDEGDRRDQSKVGGGK